MPDIVLKNRDGEPQTYEGVTDVALLTTDGELISFANSGDGAKLNPPTISYTNSSGAITITNPSTNGNFTKNLKLFDNGELVGSVEYTGTGYGSKSINISTIPESESHSLTASCSGFGVLESDHSAAIDLIQVVYDLTNLTTTSPVWAYKSGSLTATITPTENRLWKRPTTVSVTYVSSGAAVTNTYDKMAGTITISANLLTEAIKITASAEVQDGVYQANYFRPEFSLESKNLMSSHNSEYMLLTNAGRVTGYNYIYGQLVAIGKDMVLTTGVSLITGGKGCVASGNKTYAIFFILKSSSPYWQAIDCDLTITDLRSTEKIIPPYYQVSSLCDKLWSEDYAIFNSAQDRYSQYQRIRKIDNELVITDVAFNSGVYSRAAAIMGELNGNLIVASGLTSGYGQSYIDRSVTKAHRIDADGTVTALTDVTNGGISVGGSLWGEYFAVLGTGNDRSSPKNKLSVYSSDFTKLPDIALPSNLFSPGFATVRDAHALFGGGGVSGVIELDKDLTVVGKVATMYNMGSPACESFDGKAIFVGDSYGSVTKTPFGYAFDAVVN